MYFNRLIFKTSLGDELFYLKDTILINFNTRRNGISSSQLNGGISKCYKSVFNQHLTQEKIDYLVNHDLEEYLINECEKLKIDSEFSTGLVTLAKMKNLSIVSKKYRQLEVTAITTAGVRTNAAKAGDPASYYEENGVFGTINSIILINAKLDENVLVQALNTATEAKTVALNNLKIPSQYSNGYATGTGTDGICIFSNIESDNKLANADKHSKLGELISKTVIESITKAVSKQVWITPKSQSNVLVRLNRYSLDINEFYNDLNKNKFEFIKQLQIDSKKQDNVAITTSVLNLFDEVALNLIDRNAANMLCLELLKKCNSYPIRMLLNYWINYYL